MKRSKPSKLLLLSIFCWPVITWAQADTSFKWSNHSFWDRLVHREVAAFKDQGVQFILNPALEQITFGKGDWYRNGRGFHLAVQSKKFILNTGFMDVQDYNPHEQITTVFELKEAAAGHGRWKRFKKNGYDYTRNKAEVIWKPTQNLSIGGGFGFNNRGSFARYAHPTYAGLSTPYLNVELQTKPSASGTTWVYGNSFSVATRLQRTASSASAESQFKRNRIHRSFVQLGLQQFFIEVGESFTSQKPESNTNWQDYNLVPGLVGLLGRSTDGNAAIQEFTVGSKNLLQTDSITGTKISFNTTLFGRWYNVEGFAANVSLRVPFSSWGITERYVRGRLMRQPSLSLRFKIQHQRINPNVLNKSESLLHLGYHPLGALLMPAQTRFSLEPSYRRMQLFLNYTFFESYTPNGTDNGGITDLGAGFLINPSYNFILKIGYIGHSAYTEISNFYLSLSTNFGRNSLEF